MKKVLAAIALSALATPALAVERPFFGLDYEMMNYEFSGPGGEDYATDGVRLRFGTMLTRSWGLQADVGIGVGDDRDDAGLKVKMQNAYSLSGVYRLNMGKAGLYGYAGYSYVTTRATPPGGAAISDEDDGASYGVGIDFPGFAGNSIEIDYRSVIDKENYTQTGISIGMRRYF